MKLVTIFNYDLKDLKYRTMCYMFLDSVLRHSDMPVEILTERDNTAAVVGRLTVDPRVKVTRCHRYQISGAVNNPIAYHNVGFKLYNLCGIDEPFIYLDADTYVMHSLDPLVKAATERPYIAVDHQALPVQMKINVTPYHLNSGLQIVGDPNMLRWDRIRHLMLDRAYQFDVAGTDQAILWHYFKQLDYDYHHPAIGTEWNAFARCATFYKDQNQWRATTRYLEKHHPIYIAHYYLRKPWEIGCPVFAGYSKEVPYLENSLRLTQ